MKHVILSILAAGTLLAQITPIPGGGSGGGSGTVTSVATGCGLSGGTITGSGTIVSRWVANAQTGATYDIVAGDCGKVITINNGSAVAITLPTPDSSIPDGWFVIVKVIGAGTGTVTPTGATISGAASIDIGQGEFAIITSNGTNYLSMTSRIAIGSGLSKSTAATGVTLNTAPEVLTLTSTSTLTNKTITDSTNSIGPNALKNYVAGGGTADVQTATLSPALPAYATGGRVCWLPIAANTSTTPTLDVNGLGAKTITKLGTAVLAANDLTATAIACAVYDGTGYQLQNPQTVSGGGGSPGGSGTELQYRGGASTFSALSGSSVPNAGEVIFGTGITPASSASRALVSIGGAPVAASASGTVLSLRTPATFSGDGIRLERGSDNLTLFNVDNNGNATMPGTLNSITISNNGYTPYNAGSAVIFANYSTAATSGTQITIGGTAASNYIALGVGYATGTTSQLRINGDIPGVMIGRTANTTSLSNVDLYVGNRTAASATGMLIEEGATQGSIAGLTYKLYNATAGTGSTVWSISSGGIPQWGSTSEATCNSSTRGQVVMVQGGAGVADTFRQCRKDAADAYAWNAL